MWEGNWRKILASRLRRILLAALCAQAGALGRLCTTSTIPFAFEAKPEDEAAGALTTEDMGAGGCGPSPRKILGIALAVAVALSTRPLKTVVVAPSLAKLSRIFARVVDGEAVGVRKMPLAGLTVIEASLLAISGAGARTAGAVDAVLGAGGGGGGAPRFNNVW